MKDRKPVSRKPGLVCTTVSAKTGGEMATKAAAAFALGTDIVELRLDLLRRPSLAVAEELSHLAKRSVFTVRRRDEGGGFEGTEPERLALIEGLCELQPLYVDIELTTVEESRGWFAELPRTPRKIVSWHDFSKTPSFPALKRSRSRAGAAGSIAKVVTTAKSGEDNLKVLRLYEENPENLIAFCMGALGMVSRVLSLQLGSPIVYASLPNEPVAPGQLSVSTVLGLKRIWEGRRGW